MADAFVARLHAADRRLFGPKASKASPDGQAEKLPVDEQERVKAKRNWDAYVRGRDAGHLDWVELARKFDSYYRGEQWEKAIMQQLDSEGRPYLTFNMVLSTINAIKGEYINKRQMIKFRPRGRGATEEVANALDYVVQQIQYNNKSGHVEATVLEDGIIEDRGYFEITIDFSDNIHGEVREVALDPRDVILDSGAKEYDPRTWKEVIVSRWMTPDEIEVLWGKEKADRLRGREVDGRFSHDSVQFDVPTKTFGEDVFPHNFVPDTHEDELTVRRIRVIRRQHRQLARSMYFVDPEHGDMRPAPTHWDDVRVAQHAVKFGLDIIEKPELRIRWTTSADDVLLEDDWSLYDRLTVVPFFPYFRRGFPHGLVRHLISPQDMLNKVSSQELHVVNTTANSGWVFEQGSLINMDADDLEKVGAKTGLVIEFRRDGQPPQKIKPNDIPAGLNNISNKAQLFFRHVSGLPETFLGFSSREVSGVAVQEQRTSALGQLEVIFDNLAKTRTWRAEFYLELIQRFYTETRVIQVVQLDEEGHERLVEFNVNEMEQTVDGEGNTIEETVINDLTIGEYAVVATTAPHQDAQQDATFSQLMQMREQGIMVPDWLFYENSRIPNKMEVAEIVRSLQGAAEPTQEEIEMAQMREQLQLQGMQAAVAELMAKASEREARTQLLLAQADVQGQANTVELEKAGAEMRLQLEKLQADLQQKVAELQARIAISREKNQTVRQVAQIKAMGDRMNTAVKQTLRDVDKAANLGK
jgi:hypothetical protein